MSYVSCLRSLMWCMLLFNFFFDLKGKTLCRVYICRFSCLNRLICVSGLIFLLYISVEKQTWNRARKIRLLAHLWHIFSHRSIFCFKRGMGARHHLILCWKSPFFGTTRHIDQVLKQTVCRVRARRCGENYRIELHAGYNLFADHFFLFTISFLSVINL